MFVELLPQVHVAIGKGPGLFQGPLFVHIAAGVVGTITGYIAVSTRKGGELHKTTGRIFVYAMLVMALVGATIAAFEVKIGSVDAGLLTAYLVVTALTAVRPRTEAIRRIELGAMLVA